MAKYTEKSESDLAWDTVRREVQYRINLAAATWRVQKLNEILPALQLEFEEALLQGTVLSLEAASVSWIDEALSVEPSA